MGTNFPSLGILTDGEFQLTEPWSAKIGHNCVDTDSVFITNIAITFLFPRRLREDCIPRRR